MHKLVSNWYWARVAFQDTRILDDFIAGKFLIQAYDPHKIMEEQMKTRIAVSVSIIMLFFLFVGCTGNDLKSAFLSLLEIKIL